jgi:hypothetical protein
MKKPLSWDVSSLLRKADLLHQLKIVEPAKNKKRVADSNIGMILAVFSLDR